MGLVILGEFVEYPKKFINFIKLKLSNYVNNRF